MPANRPDVDLLRVRSKTRVTASGGSNAELGSADRPVSVVYLRAVDGPGTYKLTVVSGALTLTKVR